MLLPVLAPRRPSFVFRYVGPACLLLLLAYSFSLPAKSHTAETALHRLKKQQLHYHAPAGIQQIPVIASSLELGQAQDDQQRSNGAVLPGPAMENDTQRLSELQQHPIEHLIDRAEKTFQELLAKESHSIKEAAKEYRRRRGRHPPPGFDNWYRFATERNSIMIEDFWDQIYHDLNPFWALPAGQIQREAGEFEMKISVRDGRATTKSSWFWTQIWLDMIGSIESFLPDMDIALNAMDEPRVVVPWEELRNYVVEADRTAGMARPEDVISEFQRLDALEQDAKTTDGPWETAAPYWEVVSRGCAPSSPARHAATLADFNGPPNSSAANAGYHMYNGFVSNSSLSGDICHQPDLQGLQGIFIEPLSIASTASMFPIFGGSKLSVNNDILLPAPMYWSEEERFSVGGAQGIDWADKDDRAIWRGVATGGRNRESNWRGFHRHRFVAMNNGTMLARVETEVEAAPNFELPAPSYKLGAQKDGRLGPWVQQWSDCSFVDLMCFERTEHGRCPYTNPYFSVSGSLPLKEQFKNKYLPDIDGNSFSGRYLAFLKSTSLPIKATIWKEWHDSRLISWKHFVPMDSRFGDWFGIMQFFLGYGDTEAGHDSAAEKIATEGKKWAEKVTRKEDMQVYVLRLLLEYARMFDEKRELLGWVGDLVEQDALP